MNHNYTGCQEEACDLCDAHGEGYSVGKDKGLFECAVATCHMSATPECRCSPCVSLRYAIHAMSEGTPGPRVSAPTFGKCFWCARQGMLIEIGPNKVCPRCWV